jgi:hypothetical protein
MEIRPFDCPRLELKWTTAFQACCVRSSAAQQGLQRAACHSSDPIEGDVVAIPIDCIVLVGCLELPKDMSCPTLRTSFRLQYD